MIALPVYDGRANDQADIDEDSEEEKLLAGVLT